MEALKQQESIVAAAESGLAALRETAATQLKRTLPLLHLAAGSSGSNELLVSVCRLILRTEIEAKAVQGPTADQLETGDEATATHHQEMYANLILVKLPDRINLNL